MKRAAWIAIALAGCATEDNLGNHVFGDARWSVSIGSPGEERATAIAIDTIGNVIVAGTCDGLVEFGATRAECHGSFISRRAYDTGREDWTALLQGAVVSSLTLDEAGYVLATGSYTGSANIAGTVLQTMGSDPFIAVFGGNGTLEGVVALGLVGTASSSVGTLEPDGCIYITGGFHGTMPAPGGAMTNDSGELDGYVSGDFADTAEWTVRLHGDGDQLGRAIALQGEHLSVLARSDAPFAIGAQPVVAPAWPASALVQFSILGELQWVRALPETSEHLAVARDGALVVGGRDELQACSRLRSFDVKGNDRWVTECLPDRSHDAIAIDPSGMIVSGGRNFDLASGELFLAATGPSGESLGSIEAQPYAFERDSSLDGIAIEPSGEVGFVASINHPFDFGNGMVPFAGLHDAVVVKLDSPSGHDGPVVLLRE